MTTTKRCFNQEGAINHERICRMDSSRCHARRWYHVLAMDVWRGGMMSNRPDANAVQIAMEVICARRRLTLSDVARSMNMGRSSFQARLRAPAIDARWLRDCGDAIGVPYDTIMEQVRLELFKAKEAGRRLRPVRLMTKTDIGE